MNSQIQALITRKAKADALPPEIRQRYAEDYRNIVFELAKLAVNHQLPYWDEEVNSKILSSMFRSMSKQYEYTKPYIEWMCKSLIPEVDESFRVRDQGRFYQCIQVARQQLSKV